MLPNPALLKILEAALQPCPAFAGVCSAMRWNPRAGHVPRGFAGALGGLDEVRLVLVTAEPGDPHAHESYNPDGSPRAILEESASYVYGALRDSTDLFHRNLRYILNLCWPGEALNDQLRRAWLTDTVLCSAT